jgi:D-3-phosphoglycerate dehydrogenase
MKVLLLEGIHSGAEARFRDAGYGVEVKKGASNDKDLLQQLKAVDVVGIRSKTQLMEPVLTAHPHLLAIGAFCIGTNQIDLVRANHLGIPVFNAPYSNTRSVAEMVIAEMILLARQLGDRNMAAHQGRWLKSAVGSNEVRGKTLGIIGYGHIGSQVSVLAESMGLRVVFHDIIKKLPMGNARSVETQAELLGMSDFVTLHVPETPQTHGMIGAGELRQMKKGAYLINASRGTVVHIEALAQALESGHLAGAAVDVFPVEPESNDDVFRSPLQGHSNVFLTPHVGGSTEEAQEAIGQEVAESLLRYIQLGSTLGAVNFPQLDLPPIENAQRISNVHHNVPGVLREINSIVSKAGANIKAQYLSTDAQIGYLVMDLESAEAQSIAREISALKTSLKTRLIAKP